MYKELIDVIHTQVSNFQVNVSVFKEFESIIIIGEVDNEEIVKIRKKVDWPEFKVMTSTCLPCCFGRKDEAYVKAMSMTFEVSKQY